MNWLSVVKSPLIGVLLFFLGIFFCGWQLDKAASRLAVDRPTDDDPPKDPATSVLLKRMLLGLALALTVFFILYQTKFLVASVLVVVGCLYFWHEAYKSRVRPLVQAGLPKAKAWYLTAIQAFWIIPLAIAVTFHLRGKYGAL